nr:uncharacterized protein CI109_003720 [Kwoniella shandongensis]KAA5528065.1 hypothetical protein CI109_003720 [Kwoniella shandongensis]
MSYPGYPAYTAPTSDTEYAPALYGPTLGQLNSRCGGHSSLVPAYDYTIHSRPPSASGQSLQNRTASRSTATKSKANRVTKATYASSGRPKAASSRGDGAFLTAVGMKSHMQWLVSNMKESDIDYHYELTGEDLKKGVESFYFESEHRPSTGLVSRLVNQRRIDQLREDLKAEKERFKNKEVTDDGRRHIIFKKIDDDETIEFLQSYQQQRPNRAPEPVPGGQGWAWDTHTSGTQDTYFPPECYSSSFQQFPYQQAGPFNQIGQGQMSVPAQPGNGHASTFGDPILYNPQEGLTGYPLGGGTPFNASGNPTVFGPKPGQIYDPMGSGISSNTFGGPSMYDYNSGQSSGQMRSNPPSYSAPDQGPQEEMYQNYVPVAKLKENRPGVSGLNKHMKDSLLGLKSSQLTAISTKEEPDLVKRLQAHYLSRKKRPLPGLLKASICKRTAQVLKEYVKAELARREEEGISDTEKSGPTYLGIRSSGNTPSTDALPTFDLASLRGTP